MNRRQMLATGAVAAVAAAGGAGWALWRARSDSALSDAEQSLWTQRFDRPGGGELAMGALRGKPLVLNFWATWCAPCVKEMPMLDAFHREHQAQGWQVVGLAVDGPTPVREFLTKVPVTFPVGLAGFTGVDLAKSLGNERGGLPFSAVFDRQGSVAFRKLGTITPDDLDAWVKKLS
jgi:thiol-disulfide isomerase/thioredoxin